MLASMVGSPLRSSTLEQARHPGVVAGTGSLRVVKAPAPVRNQGNARRHMVRASLPTVIAGQPYSRERRRVRQDLTCNVGGPAKRIATLAEWAEWKAVLVQAQEVSTS